MPDGGELPESPTRGVQKEKSKLRRRLSFLKRNARSNSTPYFSWKVAREELIKPIWRHQPNATVTRQEKLVLETNPGKHNPKVSFILYPYGVFKDENKAVTMAVRTSISDKCPPLPPLSELRLNLTAWGGEGAQREELSRPRSVTEKLSTSVFYVYSVVTHDQLKECKCKYIHLDMEVTCRGIQRGT